MALCAPYSGHGHPTNTPAGVRHFQQLGLCNFFYGPPDLSAWKADILRANGTWQLTTVQFNNAAFLCITMNDTTSKENDLEFSHDLDNLHKFVSANNSYSLHRVATFMLRQAPILLQAMWRF